MLPGLYINVVGQGPTPPPSGSRGIVGLPIALPWLADHEIIEVWPRDVAALVTRLGVAALAIQEAAKNASKLLIYRLNTGTKAAGTLGNLTATAKYGGTYGNKLTVSIENVVGEPGAFHVITWAEGREVNRQKVTDASGLVANEWVVFSHTVATLATNAGRALTGGTDGSVTTQDYADALTALETANFTAAACLSDDASIKALFIAFARRLRGEGRYVQVVVPDTANADYEGVISVKNGVVLDGGVAVSKVVAAAYIAGATAGCPLTASLTSSPYLGAVDVDARFTVQQQEDMARQGHLVFVPSFDGENKVVIQKDINSLTTFTLERPYSFSKNKIIRTVDDVAAYIVAIGHARFVGKVPNNQNGRDMFKAAILEYLQSLGDNVLRDVVPEDIMVSPGTLIDSSEVTYALRPVDTMDVIYNTIVVSG